ncbi:MAG: T9SS type A sorting domain-containing protein [candidate division Zixibacteria bacterium]|nr:T9SS type A sorting domain-containing protein [candidate division Zixibacteria bacterium]
MLKFAVMVACCRIIWGLILSLALSIAAVAQSDTEFGVSSDYSASEQNHPTVAVGSAGRFVVAWEDMRAGDGDIYCRIFTENGTPVADEFAVCDDTVHAVQVEPDLASDWYGNDFLVWTDFRNGSYPFGPDVYFQKVDSTGPAGSNRNMTVELPDSSHQSPAVGVSGWGRTVVVWADLRYCNWDVFGQVLDPSGLFVGANRKINDDVSATSQHEPEVAVSSAGWSVVVWYDGRNGNDDIYLQKCDSTGLPVGSNIRVNTDEGTARQKFPSVAIGGDGVITVAWTDWRTSPYPANPDIYGQRFDAAMNRLGSNFPINLDGTQAAQRDAKVAADRMGNVVVVWSDSAGGDWNVSGQVIDATGRLIGQNFTVNQTKTGRQLFPDVALDGHRMYLVWADNRNGNYDIYGRVIIYNDPSLAAEPSRLEVPRDWRGGDTAVAVVINNAGYGELPFSLKVDQDWIILSAISGTTPDTVLVTMRPDSLGWGDHHGRITMIDQIHNDSTAFLPVSLTVTGPVITCRPDSLHFRALVEVGSPASQTMAVVNAGTNAFNWRASSTETWLRVTPETGTDGGIVTVDCDITTLATGTYSGFIVVEDSFAVNSPESTLVVLDLETGKPYLVAQPDTVIFRLALGEAATDSVQIINGGSGTIHWQAFTDIVWLVSDSTGGVDGDFLRFTINADTLPPGRYSDSIRVEDTVAFNNPLFIPIIFDVYQPDSIFIPPIMTKPGEAFQVPVWLYEYRPVSEGRLTFIFDSRLMAVDSVVPIAGNFPGGQVTAILDTLGDRFTLDIQPDSAAVPRNPGKYQLADIYATANDSLVDSAVFQAAAPEDFYLTGGDQLLYHPVLDAGLIEITYPTSVGDRGDGQRPAGLLLGQNIPNPFNAATLISFSLDQAGPVTMEIFNILGQRVARLVNATLPAGTHRVWWDGRDEEGDCGASGVYLYAITTASGSMVRKMVYLK